MKKAQVFVYGDQIDTDRIIAGKYTKTLDKSELAKHVMEDLDPDFAARVQAGAIVVAGAQFGCGSSREQAPLALKTAGVQLIIARSFARIFFRNAINIGLAVLEIPDHSIGPDADLQFDLSQGRVEDRSSGRIYQGTPMPPLLREIIAAGGLVAYLRERGTYPALASEESPCN